MSSPLYAIFQPSDEGHSHAEPHPLFGSSKNGPIDSRFSTIFEYFEAPQKTPTTTEHSEAVHQEDIPKQEGGHNIGNQKNRAEDSPTANSPKTVSDPEHAPEHAPDQTLTFSSNIPTLPLAGQSVNKTEPSAPISHDSRTTLAEPERLPTDSYQANTATASPPQETEIISVQNFATPLTITNETFPVLSEDGLAILVGGNAMTNGDEAIVTGFIEASIIDFGPYSIAFGEASFSAVSVDYDGAAQSAASSYANIVGADFLFETGVASGLFEETPLTTISASASNSSFFAIEIEGFEPENGPINLFPAPETLSAPIEGNQPETIAEPQPFSSSINIDDLITLANSLIDNPGQTQLAQIYGSGTVFSPFGHISSQISSISQQSGSNAIDGHILLIA